MFEFESFGRGHRLEFQLYEVLRANLHEHEPALHHLYHANNRTLNVACHDSGKVVGGCIGWHVGSQAYLHFIAVAPEARRQKVGATLLEVFEQGMQEVQPTNQIAVNTHNGAVSWFQERGYVEENRTPEGVISMVKPLVKPRA